MFGLFKTCRSYLTKIYQGVTEKYNGAAAKFLSTLTNLLRFRLLLNGYLSLQKMLKLDDYQIGLLSNQSSWMYRLIDIGKYNVKDVIKLSRQDFKKLNEAYTSFPDLIGYNLTINAVLNLTEEQRNKLKCLESLKRVDAEALDFYHQFIYGGYDGDKNLLPLILNTSIENIHMLKIKNIQHLIASSKLSVELALKLTDNQIKNLESRYIYNLIDLKKISLNDALKLNDKQRETLNLYIIFKLINDNKLELQEALKLNLTPQQVLTLSFATPLIERYKIELRTVLTLTSAARRALLSDPIQQLIIEEMLTVDQILRLAENRQAITNLNNDIIFDLIMHRELSVRDAILLTARDLIEIEERIRRNANMQAQGRNILPIFDNYNGSQNTHIASIHKSASISAEKLYECYKEKIQSHQDQIVEAIKQWSLSVSDDGSVKVCVEKISREPIGRHEDPSSKISVYQLLMLAWCAIHDDHKRTGSVENALKLLADGLSEIANGYGPGKFICCGGAFNKIIEKLVGIIDGVELKVITMEQATNNMHALVTNAIKDYVKNLVTEGSSEAECIEKLKRDGISMIWENVGDQIQKELIDEFGELFNNSIDDPKFKEFISIRDDVELDKIFPPSTSTVASDKLCKRP